jgi:hypothetical protein
LLLRCDYPRGWEERAMDKAGHRWPTRIGLGSKFRLKAIAAGALIVAAFAAVPARAADWMPALQQVAAAANTPSPTDILISTNQYAGEASENKRIASGELIAFGSNCSGRDDITMKEQGAPSDEVIWRGTKTDLHTYPESHFAKVIEGYQKEGIKFQEFTVDWFLQHPESLDGQRKAVPILAGR